MGPVRFSRGFTLVELLVVMLITGLLAGVLTTTLAMNRGDGLQQEAQHLAWLLQETVVRARAEAVHYNWQPKGGGYVLSRDAGEGGEGRESAHQFSSGVRVLRLKTDGVEKSELRIAGRGIGPAIRITLANDERRIDVVSEGLGQFAIAPTEESGDARR